MHRFIKLSCNITTSTIWAEDDSTLRLWIWMMATADRHGLVSGTIPGIAIAARVSLEACERIIAKFEGPDKYSKNPANDGRRIEKVEGGWCLLNYDYYRDMQGGDPDWQKERHRKNQSAYRDRKKGSVTGDVTEQAVTDDRKSVTVTTEAEAEAEEPPKVQKQKQAAFSLPDWIPSDLWADYLEMRKKIGKPATERAKVLAVATLDKLRMEGHGAAAVLEQSIMNSWQGLFEIKQPKENGRNGFVKQSVTPGNLAAGSEVLQRLAEGRSDHRDAGVAGQLLRAPTATSGVLSLPVGSSGTNPAPVASGVQPGSPGVQILSPAGGTASLGRMPDRRPTF